MNAEFAIVFHCQNFTLYSRTDLENEDNLIIRVLMIGPKVSVIYTHTLHKSTLATLCIKFIAEASKGLK